MGGGAGAGAKKEKKRKRRSRDSKAMEKSGNPTVSPAGLATTSTKEDLPLLTSVLEELGIPELFEALEDDECRGTWYTAPTPIDKGKQIANFVTLMYVGHLMQEGEDTRSACILSSGGSLNPSEVEDVVCVMEEVKQRRVLLPEHWLRVEGTLDKLMATRFFWTEDVEKSSRVLDVARRLQVEKETYSKLCKAAVFKRERSLPPFEMRLTELELVKVEKLLDLPPFAQKLIFTRGPNSIVPHENAMRLCISKAMLLLMRSQLRVTFPVALTYANLWTAPDAFASAMLQQLHEAPMPSSIDRMLVHRVLTWCCPRARGLPLYHLDVMSDYPARLLKLLTPGEIRLLDMIKYPVVDESQGPMRKQWREKKEEAALHIAQVMRICVRGRCTIGEAEFHRSHFRFSVPGRDRGDREFCSSDSDSDSDSEAEPEPVKPRLLSA